MAESLYTDRGLERLAEIARQARGHRTYEDFEVLSDLPASTFARLEKEEVGNPQFSTLCKLAPFTPYNAIELMAIGMEMEAELHIRNIKIAEDLMPFVEQLPRGEMARLGQMIFAILGELVY